MVSPAKPASVDDETWADLPDECRAEATARAAWLVMRGEPPIDAFYLALEGMVRDQADPDIERMPSWDMLRAACAAWRGTSRRPDGSPRYEVFALALAADGLVEAALEFPDEPMEAEAVLSQYCACARTVTDLARHVAAEALARRPPEPEAPPEAEQGWDAGHEPEPAPAGPAWAQHWGAGSDDWGFGPYAD